MNIQQFGAPQRNLFVQPGSTTATSAKAAASATNATRSQQAAPAPDAAPSAPVEPAMRRRIEHFVERADKRIDHLLENNKLTTRQQEALRAAQETFHSQMGRLDRALDGGEANEAMHNILSSLRGSIDSILQEPTPANGSGLAAVKPDTVDGKTTRRGSANQIDTLA
ncbi:MAG: hypothetical protein IPJ77_04200 [Planctomycetes bacterium]|nr:hypothetical protein [Planctomycetota bacterium]